MSQATVYEILEEIQQLSAEDRRLLDDLLAQQGDAEWREEAPRVRQLAREKGIDQEAIDQAVDAVRHGA